jgi:peptidoglycan/LPS O-acetylase OafA/YrhL
MVDQSRDAGIDIIKAICIVLILIWHLQPISGGMLPYNNYASFLGKEAIRLFYYNITLLAVPTFILISLYLFIKKASQIENYWKKRAMRLIQIFLFWVCIQFIVYLLLGGKLPLPLKTIIPGGGPDLPYVGGSVFYFLFILILCTIWTFLFLKLAENIKLILSIVIVALSCLHFALSPLYGLGIDTMAMENYYIYIPVAYYLQNYKDKFVQYRIYFFIGFFLSVFAEFTFRGITSAYGRLSIFFGVLSLVSLFMSGRFATNRPIEFLAKYSLGIFALHKYFQYLSNNLYVVLQHQGGIISIGHSAESMLQFIATVTLTCFTAYLLGKTKLRIYVS